MALLEKLLGGDLRAKERALEVNGDDEIELLLGSGQDRGARLHAGVVDHYVELAKRLDRRVYQLLQVGDLGDIALHDQPLAARVCDLLQCRVRGSLVFVIVNSD